MTVRTWGRSQALALSEEELRLFATLPRPHFFTTLFFLPVEGAENYRTDCVNFWAFHPKIEPKKVDLVKPPAECSTCFLYLYY